MKLNFENFGIKWDGLSYVVFEMDGERERNLMYFLKLENAAKELLTMKINKSEAKSIEELIKAIFNAQKGVCKVLQDLKQEMPLEASK